MAGVSDGSGRDGTQRSLWFSIVCSSFLWIFLSFVFYLFTSGPINPITIDVISPENFHHDVPLLNNLSDANRLSVLPYHGPESIVVINDAIYAGVVEGFILKINDSGVHQFAKFGQPDCQVPALCGRPLGMRLSPDENYLIVVDAYLGLFSVSVKDGAVRKLFPLDENFKVTFFNDFDFLPSGEIILSETSIKYPLDMLMYDLLEGRPNGRLLKIDPNTGEWHTLLDGLYFPNGVQLHQDGQSVLIAETPTFRVLQLNLTDGQLSVFIDGLPGIPDNIRPSAKGGYWIPVSNLRNTVMGRIFEFIFQYPTLRRALLKLSLLPMSQFISHTSSAALIRVDQAGRVAEAIWDPDGKVVNAVEVAERASTGELFVSSYFLPYISRLHV